MELSEIGRYQEGTAFLAPWDTQCETRLRMERVPAGLPGGTQGSEILFLGQRGALGSLQPGGRVAEHGAGELVPGRWEDREHCGPAPSLPILFSSHHLPVAH